MRSSFYRLFLLSVLTTLSLIATSCEEDVRYSGQTQYLGGVHGNAPTAGRAHRYRFLLGRRSHRRKTFRQNQPERTARLFLQSGMLVGISQLSTGREGLITPIGHFSIIQKGH